MEMKERHRCIKQKLNPKRKRAAAMSIFFTPKIFFAPMPEQNQPGRKRVEQPTLGHEHGQRNTFPRDVVDVLVIDEFEIAQKLKTGEAAIEKKTRDRKTAAPTIEGVERGDGREQADPEQAGNKIDIRLQEQRVEEIDPGGVTKMMAED